MNSFTLWRGSKPLGQFDERDPVMHHGKRVGGSGILAPSGVDMDAKSVMQTRVRILPDQPVFQVLRDPIVLGPSPSPAARNPGPQELHRMSEKEARGLPVDQILTIRDRNDAVVDTDLITLQLFVIPDNADLAAISAANGNLITSRRFWRVSYARHDHAT